MTYVKWEDETKNGRQSCGARGSSWVWVLFHLENENPVTESKAEPHWTDEQRACPELQSGLAICLVPVFTISKSTS